MKKGVLILLLFVFFSTMCFADITIPPPPTPFGTPPSSTANVPAPPTPFEQQQVQNQTSNQTVNQTLPPSPSAPSTEPASQPTVSETLVTQLRTRHALTPPNPKKIIPVELPQERITIVEPKATPSSAQIPVVETQTPVIAQPKPSVPGANEVEVIVAPKKTSWSFVIWIIVLFAFVSGGAYAVMRYFEERKKQSSELGKYIDTALKQGFKLPVIRQALLQAGWSEKTIDERFAEVKK